jgi:hypothetical protein
VLRLVGEPAAEVAVPTIAFGNKLACHRKASFPFSLFKTSLSLFASGDYPFHWGGKLSAVACFWLAQSAS